MIMEEKPVEEKQVVNYEIEHIPANKKFSSKEFNMMTGGTKSQSLEEGNTIPEERSLVKPSEKGIVKQEDTAPVPEHKSLVIPGKDK